VNSSNSLGSRWRRIRALVVKESLQVVRDPASLVAAFVLPALLLLLFGYGISFDPTRIKVGLVIEKPTPETAWFLASLANTPFFDVRVTKDRKALLDDFSARRLVGIIALSGDFTERLARGDTATSVTKLATIETGMQVRVPGHIKKGDRIKIRTEDGEFKGRVGQ